MENKFRSSGYFRQKADRVKSFLETVKKEAGGRFVSFLSGGTAALRAKLLKQKGIGPETADSILLYAAGRPVFVVDAYTRRIGSRWGIFKGSESYDEIQNFFMRTLPRSARFYGEVHALLVQLAKEFCRKKPLCLQCPVKRFCNTGVTIS
jgi:endonuclease-3 related protein